MPRTPRTPSSHPPDAVAPPAPDAVVTPAPDAVVTPAPDAVVAPAPAPPFAPDAPAPSSFPQGAEALLSDRPEIAVGGAFAGGLVLALILKRLAS